MEREKKNRRLLVVFEMQIEYYIRADLEARVRDSWRTTPERRVAYNYTIIYRSSVDSSIELIVQSVALKPFFFFSSFFSRPQ